MPILQFSKSSSPLKGRAVGADTGTREGTSMSLLGAPHADSAASLSPRAAERVPLWQEPLWDDVILKQSTSGIPFSYPDTSQCLAHQKLQMVNMCIMSVEENQSVVLGSIPRLTKGKNNIPY